MKRNAKQLILRIVLAVIISLVLGLTVYTANARKLTGDLMPMPFGIGVGDVLSGSMEPELSVADLIIVRRTNDYEVGDTVVFQKGNSLTVHKIIEINGDEVITKGTANDAADEPIKMEIIKGEVVFVIPGMGYVFDVIRSPICATLILALAAFLMYKSYQKEKEHEDDDVIALMEEIKKLREAQTQAEQPAREVSAEEGNAQTEAPEEPKCEPAPELEASEEKTEEENI